MITTDPLLVPGPEHAPEPRPQITQSETLQFLDIAARRPELPPAGLDFRPGAKYRALVIELHDHYARFPKPHRTSARDKHDLDSEERGPGLYRFVATFANGALTSLAIIEQTGQSPRRHIPRLYAGAGPIYSHAVGAMGGILMPKLGLFVSTSVESVAAEEYTTRLDKRSRDARLPWDSLDPRQKDDAAFDMKLRSMRCK